MSPALFTRPRAAVLATCLVLPLALAGCSSGSGGTSSSTTSAAAGFPVTVSECGRDTTFDSAPKRVVVMNGGSAAEVTSLIALGVGDSVVANAQNYGASDVPDRQAKIEALPTGGVKLNDMQDIPREAMIGLRPDLVLSTYDGGFSAQSGFATREDLSAIGAKAYVPALNCGPVGTTAHTPTIDDSYSLLRDLGKIFGRTDTAESLISESTAAIEKTSRAVSGAPEKNVLVVFPNMGMGGSDDLSAVARRGIWNDVLAKAGARNPFDDPAGTSIGEVSKEALATTPVDALVVVDYMNPDPRATAERIFARFPQWPASKNKSVTVLTDSIYLGPDNAVAVDRIARLVHPDRF